MFGRKNCCFVIFLIVAVTVSLFPQSVCAQQSDLIAANAGSKSKKQKRNKVKYEETTDIFDLSIDDNIDNPHLGKQADVISEFQGQEALAMKHDHHDVELMRNGEVIVFTIPAGQLFNPNDTVLTDLGKVSLKPFLKYLATPGLYKMILAMHSDNTGSDAYTLALSRARVNAVFDWIDGQASTDFVVPYALGSIEPIVPNNSVLNRRSNRRLEIYLVPGYAMIEQAKKNKIKL
ncbi:MAG: OmpA family protein [Muribaculaceae bacterium]|jgi:outer membrane protein OmpA-like peptidoglycan-associated protein|nr:OmpA family protein [Muribaculaceae bacterium]